MTITKFDIINHVQKVVYDGSTVSFIIQTDGDNDFWWWSVCWREVADYFQEHHKPSAINELANEKLSKIHCEQFVNDCDNDMLGVSCSSFATVEDALKDLGVL